MTYKIALFTLAGAITLLSLSLFSTSPQLALGEGYIGWPVHMQAADGTADVGPDFPTTLFSDAADCKARVISTTDDPIWLSFDDDYLASTSLAYAVGHYQAASTTVAYESGVYGCGRTTAFSLASTTITTSSF